VRAGSAGKGALGKWDENEKTGKGISGLNNYKGLNEFGILEK
jgi:hypothetical protein